jgi:PAS domain S-box-containing protein
MENHINPEEKNTGVFPAWASAQKNHDLSWFFEKIIMNAKLWMMFLDTGRNVVIWNKAAGEISGYSGTEVLGNSAIWRWIYPDATYRRGVTEKIVERIRSNKNLENFETTIRTKNGETKRISWNTRELTGNDGRSAGFIVIGDDITAIAEAKLEIHRYAEFQKSIIVNAKLWMTFLDAHNNVVIWNRAAEEITGYSGDEVIGRDEVWRWLYPDSRYRKEVTRKIKDTIRNNKALENFETRILTRRGLARYISWNTRELTGDDGTLLGYIIVGNDITEKVLAKKEIRESEELFHGIAAGASDAIALLDQNGIIRYWNPAAETLFGMNSDAVMRNNFFSLFSPAPSRDLHQSDFRTFFETHAGPFSRYPCELQMLNSAGEVLHLEMSLASLHFRGMWNALGIFRDITVRVKAEHREREILLNAIVQGSPIPQFMIDKNHTVVFWNRALEHHSGIRAADVIGTDLHWKAFYNEKRPCLADLLIDNAPDEIHRWYGKKSSKSKLVEDAFEATDFFPKMGNEGKWLYFTAALIRDSDGNVIGVLETLEDITDTMLYKPR